MEKSGPKDTKGIPMVSLLGAAVFIFVAGAFVMHFKKPPSGMLKQGFDGGAALLEKMFTQMRPETKVNIWRDSRFEKSGVITHNPDKAFDGYTMVTNGAFSGAWLLDMEGNVVHKWMTPFRKAWPNPPHISFPVKEELIYWRRALLFPNGDALAIYVANGDSPWGYGMIKVDKDSNVLWKYPQRTHHDVWVDSDGKIYALIHAINKIPPPGLEYLPKPYLEDYVAILSPDGKEIDRIGILDAFMKSDYMSQIFSVRYRSHYAGDFLHTNTVKVIDESMEDVLPFAKKGHILISMRSLSLVAVIDPKQRKVVWAQTGMWLFQHDPEFTKDGNVTLLDNYGDYMRSKTSRIIEYDPRRMKILWQWNGDSQRPLYSELRGYKHILPNGNILVTESDGGRLLEVTREKEVVWEYINPERKMDNGVAKIAVLSGARRHSRQSLPFLNEIPSSIGR